MSSTVKSDANDEGRKGLTRFALVLMAVGLLSGCNLSNKFERTSLFVAAEKPATNAGSTQTTSAFNPMDPIATGSVTSSSEGEDGAEEISQSKWDANNLASDKPSETSARLASEATHSYPLVEDHLPTSPFCQRILAEAGIESTILRSPSLKGSVNSDKDLSVGASFGLVDLKRANLKEELAAVRCVRDSVAAKLSQLLVTSNQSLSGAGYVAQSRVLKDHSSDIRRIDRDISHSLNEGLLTRVRAETLRQYLQQLQSKAAKMEGEASRRSTVDRMRKQSFQDLDRQLTAAEQRIQEIESRVRTADAVQFKTTVDYSKRGEGSDDVTISADGEVTAKIAVSMRLGAFRPRRYELEELAEQSRVDSLYEVNRGALWQTQEIARSHVGVLGSLHKQSRNVKSALRSAQVNARKGSSSYEPEMVASRLKARIDVLKLKAELAGLNATIVDTKRWNSKLSFR